MGLEFFDLAFLDCKLGYQACITKAMKNLEAILVRCIKSQMWKVDQLCCQQGPYDPRCLIQPFCPTDKAIGIQKKWRPNWTPFMYVVGHVK